MIGFTVLGGYLGVGKTTLLNHILRSNANLNQPLRIALLVNDFGDINIDAQLVESRSDSQINLANGCVCCTLTDGFTTALETLAGLVPQPEHIVVEASGVADISNLSQYGTGQELDLASIVVIADAETVQEKASDKYVGKTIQRQLKAADLIILNKVDLLGVEQKESTNSWLSNLTAGVPVLPAVNCDVPMAMVFDLQHNNSTLTKFEYETTHSHEQYSSWSFQTDQPVSRRMIEGFLAALGPDVLRCKGLFTDEKGVCLKLQMVGRRKDIESAGNKHVPGGQVVAIGLADGFDAEKLEEAASRLLKK